ncbi:MAG: hypothetical protein IKM02_05495 [Clostridia bacterium]|nr:hypothetical protein [Clostridia bacterium]
MTEEARKIVETIKEGFGVLDAMDLPAEEQKCEITRDAAMTLIAELEQVARERGSGGGMMQYYHYAKTFRRTCENPLGVDEQMTLYFAHNPCDKIQSVNYVVDEEREKETALVVFAVPEGKVIHQILEDEPMSVDQDSCDHEWTNGKTTGMDGKCRGMKVCLKCGKGVLDDTSGAAVYEMMTGMKTPKDIKLGLECAITQKCIGESCPYFRPETAFNPLNQDMDVYAKDYNCIAKSRADAYRYIHELEAKLRRSSEKKEEPHETEAGEQHTPGMADRGAGEAGA